MVEIETLKLVSLSYVLVVLYFTEMNNVSKKFALLSWTNFTNKACSICLRHNGSRKFTNYAWHFLLILYMQTYLPLFFFFITCMHITNFLLDPISGSKLLKIIIYSVMIFYFVKFNVFSEINAIKRVFSYDLWYFLKNHSAHQVCCLFA